MELALEKGKRKYLFCSDLKSNELLYNLVKQAIEVNIPFDTLVIECESDSFLSLWFNQQKMGSFLYVTGEWEFVKRIKNLAMEAGFSEYDLHLNVIGPTRKKLICSKCYEVLDVKDEVQINCSRCGLQLEVSNHYSRRLDAYLGYATI